MDLRAGLTKGEMLVLGLVPLLFAALFVPVFLRSRRAAFEDLDVQRIRRVYVAAAIYQDDHSGWMPPSLAELGGYADRADLGSPLDTRAAPPGGFPIEPTLPDLPEKVPYRISYAYLGNYIRSRKGQVRSWKQVKASTGVLASPWHETSEGKGPIYRIRADGALTVLPERTDGGFADLFTRPAKNGS